MMMNLIVGYPEIMHNAYGDEEQALSWYYYLEEHLQFPRGAERPIPGARVLDAFETNEPRRQFP